MGADEYGAERWRDGGRFFLTYSSRELTDTLDVLETWLWVLRQLRK